MTKTTFLDTINELLTPVHLRAEKPTVDIATWYDVPGLTIAVYKDGKMETKQFGVKNVKESAKVDASTLFQACSISKPFTSLAVLRLVATGKLDLDTPIEEYLGADFRNSLMNPQAASSAPKTAITLRRLLSHTAGTNVHGFPGYAVDAQIPKNANAVLESGPIVNTAKVVAKTLPGITFTYSGGGSTIVQAVLEEVTGQPFKDLMDELVLKPCQMTRSTYSQPLNPNEQNFAHSHHTGRHHLRDGPYHVYPEQAAAGLWTTPSDLLRGMVNFAKSVNGASEFLPSKIAEEVFKHTGTTLHVGSYGIGWEIGKHELHSKDSTKRMICHSGGNEGYRCWSGVVFDKNEITGFSVMTNSDEGARVSFQLRQAASHALDLPFADEKATNVPFPAIDDLPANSTKQWAGKWKLEDREVLVDLTLSARMEISILPGESLRLVKAASRPSTDSLHLVSVDFEVGIYLGFEESKPTLSLVQNNEIIKATKQ